jgi:hypothetical protein
MRGRNRCNALGVNAGETSRRSRVCSGGSITMKASWIGCTTSPPCGPGIGCSGPPWWPSAGLRSSLVLTRWEAVVLTPKGPS